VIGRSVISKSRQVIRGLNGEVEEAGMGGKLTVATVKISETSDQVGKNPTGENLPGERDGGVEGDRPVGLAKFGAINMIVKSLEDRKPAPILEIGAELLQESFPQAMAAPLAVAAVDGLVGGEVGGQVVPGDSVADFVEDGFEDEAIVEGRAAAQVLRRRWKEGLEDGPLVVSQH